MTDTRPLLLSLATERIVTRMFAMSCNPSARGESFSWEDFPDMTEKHVRAMLFLSFADEEGPTEDETEDAVISARYVARTLVDMAGFVEGE